MMLGGIQHITSIVMSCCCYLVQKKFFLFCLKGKNNIAWETHNYTIILQLIAHILLLCFACCKICCTIILNVLDQSAFDIISNCIFDIYKG